MPAKTKLTSAPRPRGQARVKALERIARAAGILCASFVFTETDPPFLTPGQEKLAQRIRREVPKVLSR